MENGSFFAKLHPDLQANVARHLSETPRATGWRERLPKGTHNLLARTNSPLAQAASEVYNQVHIYGRSKNVAMVGFTKPSSLRVSVANVVRDGTFKELGSAFDTLVVSDEPIDCVPPPAGAYRSIIQDFSALRRLIIRFAADEDATLPLADVVAAQGGQLESLTLTCPESMPVYVPPAIALHDLPSLKKLNLSSDSLEKYVNIMRACGTKLRSIFFRSNNTKWCEVIDCGLVNISLNGPAVPELEYTELLISYGAQLERAKLRRIGVDNLERIVAECPNFITDFLLHEDSLPKFVVLAPHIRRIDMQRVRAKRHFNRNFSCKDVLAFLSSKKPALEELTLRIEKQVWSISVADSIALSAPTLRRLTLKVSFLRMSNVVKVLEKAAVLEIFELALDCKLNTYGKALGICKPLLVALRNCRHVNYIAIDAVIAPDIHYFYSLLFQETLTKGEFENGPLSLHSDGRADLRPRFLQVVSRVMSIHTRLRFLRSCKTVWFLKVATDHRRLQPERTMPTDLARHLY